MACNKEDGKKVRRKENKTILFYQLWLEFYFNIILVN